MGKYQRNIKELQNKAAMWWPEQVKGQNKVIDILPLLLKSQDDFLKILSLCKKDPFQVIDLIKASCFPANLFLKQLVVLADFGGEPIQRLTRSFKDIFPNKKGKYYLRFYWNNKSYTYNFKSLPQKGIGNKKLFIDGEGLLKNIQINDLLEDMIFILLFASASDIADQGGLESCEIGTLLGHPNELEKFVKQRYIMVSKIIGGATANNLGQVAQTTIVDYLKEHLGENYKVSRNGFIILDGYDKKGGMPFDIVIEKDTKKIGIEVSFQVTTNSTIERKAGQASDREILMHKAGHKIAYILDGAGNFQRSSAIETICKHSDCTIAYTVSEFDLLINWIKESI